MDLENLEHSSEKEINDLVISVKQIILGKHLHIILKQTSLFVFRNFLVDSQMINTIFNLVQERMLHSFQNSFEPESMIREEP